MAPQDSPFTWIRRLAWFGLSVNVLFPLLEFVFRHHYRVSADRLITIAVLCCPLFISERTSKTRLLTILSITVALATVGMILSVRSLMGR